MLAACSPLDPEVAAALENNEEFRSFLQVFLAHRSQEAMANEPVVPENEIVNELEKAARDAARDVRQQVMTGAKQSMEFFARTHLLSGPQATVRFGDTVVHLDDVRVLMDPVYRAKFDAAKAAREAAFEKMQKYNRRLSKIGNAMADNFNNRPSYANSAESFQDLTKTRMLEAKVNRLEQLKRAIQPPTPPKILTPWDKFVKTKLGLRVDARWQKLVAKFEASGLSKYLVKPPSVSTVAARAAEKAALLKNKPWQFVKKHGSKIGAPRVLPVFDAAGVQIGAKYKTNKLLHWAHDGTVSRIANGMREGFWMGYSQAGVRPIKGTNRAAYVNYSLINHVSISVV